MKTTLLLCVAFALCSRGATQLWAAPDPGDRFLEAYFLIQDGDAAERQGDWAKANTKFSSALDILREIKADSPDWNPHIIEFRLKYIDDRLTELKPKLQPPEPAPPPAAPAPAAVQAPAASPAPPAAAPAAEATNPPPAVAAPPPPPVETEQVRQLTTELQRAREQVQQLEATRDELNTKLQEQLKKVAPAQTTPQIEQLLKTNQELAAKLAAAETEVAQMRERASTNAPGAAAAPPTPAAESEIVKQLRAELSETRGELQHTKEQLESTRQELGSTKQALEKAQTDSLELRRSYDLVVAQLTDANKRLASAHAAGDKDDEIIRQLRKENALLRIIAERKTLITAAEPDETEGGRTIPELRGWHPRPRAEPVIKAQPKKEPPPRQPTPPSTAEESSRGKLVAKLTAPQKPVTSQPVPVTPAPAPAPAPVSAPAPAQPSPGPTNAVPAKLAVAKPISAKPAPPVTPVTPVTPAPPASPAPAKEAAKPTPTAPKATEKAKAAPDARTLLNEARAALALKDFDGAAAKYDAVLKLEADNVVALSNLGVIRYKQGRLDEAERDLRKAVAAAPNDSNTRSLLGVIYFRKGLIEESFNELTRAVALDPRNAEAHNYLGIVLSEKGWGAAGEQEIRRAIELDPQYADAHFNLAVIYAKERTPKVELARYHYRKALDMGAQPDPELEALLKKLSEKSAEPAEPKAEEPPQE
ncbi:MAG TPA: tetratricopeptide repeat protein [Verrucomicrobiae bacterium]|nr:tetratricopeptide repeat protein [Verrucomicrobiae bacterium]